MLDVEQREGLCTDAAVSHTHQGEVQLQTQTAVQLHVFKVCVLGGGGSMYPGVHVQRPEISLGCCSLRVFHLFR